MSYVRDSYGLEIATSDNQATVRKQKSREAAEESREMSTYLGHPTPCDAGRRHEGTDVRVRRRWLRTGPVGCRCGGLPYRPLGLVDHHESSRVEARSWYRYHVSV